MPRFETSGHRNNTEKKPLGWLFQRLWNKKWPENQRDKPPANREIKKETRGLLSRLREDAEPEKRRQIKELRKTVLANPDISKDRAAIKAYQELIKITDPERFEREIGTADGIYGPKTQKAYETDNKSLVNPRRAILEAVSPTPTRPVERKPGIFNFLTRSWSGKGFTWQVAQKNYYNAQDLSNNCGPTACSIAASKLTGKNAEALEKQFTSDRPGGMSWDSPQHWLKPLWLWVKQASSLSASEIHNEISKGNVVVTSVWPRSWLTSQGHIIALVWSRKTADGYWFVNADPNYRNILRWYDFIDDDRLKWGGAKQYWVVSKNSNIA